MPRVFFALRPDPAQRSAIATAMQPLAHALRCRPVHEADLHLTLRFLGDLPEASVTALQEAVSGIAARCVRLVLTHVDCWEGARVLCLLPEPDEEQDAMGRLAGSISAAAAAAGAAPDAKPFRAHVTIGRKVPPAAFRLRRWPEPLAAPLPFTADGFVLMQSTLAPEGQRYEVLRSWPATARQPPPSRNPRPSRW